MHFSVLKILKFTQKRTFDQATMTSSEMSTYLNSQTFRVVLVPQVAKNSSTVDTSDYNAVIKYYNLGMNLK
jgi:hypothetical protein